MQKIILLIFITFGLCNGYQNLRQSIKWPAEIEHELYVNEYQKMLLSIASRHFNVTTLPDMFKEDGSEILSRLQDNLDDCKEELNSDHQLWKYNDCVHDKLDTFNTEIWELEDDIREQGSGEDYDNSSGRCKINFLLLIFLFALFQLSHFNIII